MKISHCSFRTIARAVPALVFATAAVAVLAAAQAQGGYPSIIVSLFPKDASIRDGYYLPGEMSQGKGSADLSFENPTCPKVRFSSRISIEFTHYGGETAILIKSEESPYGTIDRDAIQNEAIESGARELKQARLTPKVEKLGTGEIVYGEYMSECPPEGPATAAAGIGPLIVPNVKLRGAAWAGNAYLRVTLEGSISVDLAKAAVAEVFENLKKADFSKVN